MSKTDKFQSLKFNIQHAEVHSQYLCADSKHKENMDQKIEHCNHEH